MEQKIIIGIAGEMASGKGTVARHVQQNHGATYWSFSRILRDVIDRIYVPQGREEISDLSLMLRERFGQDLLAEVMRKDIESSEDNFFVIEAVRRQPEMDELRKIDAVVKLIYIETDIKARYDRLVDRGENAGDSRKTFEEFTKDHEHDTEQTIGPLKAEADFVIRNDATMEDLLQQVDHIISDIKK